MFRHNVLRLGGLPTRTVFTVGCVTYHDGRRTLSCTVSTLCERYTVQYGTSSTVE